MPERHPSKTVCRSPMWGLANFTVIMPPETNFPSYRMLTLHGNGTSHQMESIVPCRKTGPRQDQEPGPIVSYCASTIPYIRPGLILVQCELIIKDIAQLMYKVCDISIKILSR